MTDWHASFQPLSRAPRNRTRVLVMKWQHGVLVPITARFEPDDRTWRTDTGAKLFVPSIKGFYRLPKVEAA